jgi:uncharacterized membrane protein YfcA
MIFAGPITSGQMAVLCGFVALAGFVDAIAGGGGLISLPAYFAVGLPAHAALATNKFSSCLGTLTTVLRYWQAGKIRRRLALWAAIGALIGSAVGARIAVYLPARSINTMMLILVPTVMLFLLLKEKILPKEAGWQPGSVGSLSWVAGLIGIGIGVYDGIFGPGTGTFLAIAFHALLGLDLLAASGLARFANLASNTGALLVFLLHAKVLFPLAFLTALAGIAGNQLGSRLALRQGEKIIRPLMVGVLLLLLLEVLRRR